MSCLSSCPSHHARLVDIGADFFNISLRSCASYLDLSVCLIEWPAILLDGLN